MATASFRWTVPPSTLAKALGDYKRRLLAAIGSLADFFAAKMQAAAQQNAPWTDRTGQARAGLRAVTLKAATAVTIVLFGTVEYQIYLELAHQGRFQILLPTLEAHYGQILAALRRLVGGH